MRLDDLPKGRVPVPQQEQSEVSQDAIWRLTTSGGCLMGSALLLLHLAAPNLLAEGRNPGLTLFGSVSFLKAQRIFPVDREAFRTTFSEGANWASAVDFRSR